MSEKSPWQLWKEKKAGDPARPWDLLNPNIERVNDEILNYRLNICSSCPSLLKATGQCKKCGCVMKSKATLPHASCPIGKWGSLQNAEDVI